MAIEIASAYVSIVAETSSIPKAVDASLKQAQKGADKHGEGIGTSLSAGMGKALKAGAIGAGVAAGGVLAASITKGVGRLIGIENAEAKLSGLGHSTQAVAGIMDNAMASVKGTAFALDEAASTAAGAVAAGIKPGQELERVLKLTGDAATIAGTGMGEMGAIFNKVATSNKIQGDTIDQLNEHGIPIVQLMAKELGKTAEETVSLASEGKINFATFANAMEQGMGGAALKSADTVSGSFKNMGAAMSRFGAVVAGPIFSQAAGGFGGLTEGIDKATAAVKPFAEEFGAWINGDGIPKLKEFASTAGDMFAEFRESDLATSSVSRLAGVWDQLTETAGDVAPAVRDIIESLVQAAGATGVGTWQLLLGVLEAAASVLDATLVPVLDTVSGLMRDNQGAVIALVAAYAAFKTIPSLVGAVEGPLSNLAERAKGAVGSIKGVATASGGLTTLANYGTTSLGSFGSAMQRLGEKSEVVGKMQGAFFNAAAGADRFGRTAGTAAAAGVGLKAAGAGVLSVMGGPLGAAIGAASVGMMLYSQHTAEAAERQNSLKEGAAGVAQALKENASQAQVAAAAALEQAKLRDESTNLAKAMEGLGASGESAARGLTGSKEAAAETLKVLQAAADAETQRGKERSDSSGLARLFNIDGARDKEGQANEILNSYKSLLKSVGVEIEGLDRTQENAGPSATKLAAAIGVLGNEAATADQKTSALKQTLDLLNGKSVDLEGSQARLFASFDATGQAFANANGGLTAQGDAFDVATAAGRQLLSVTTAQREATLANAQAAFQAKASVGDLAGAQQAAAGVVQQSRQAFIEQLGTMGVVGAAADALADKYIGIPSQVSTTLSLDKSSFELNADQAKKMIDFLGAQKPSPEVDLLIQKLKENKEISVQEINDLASKTANPEVFLQGVQKLLTDAGIINAELDKAARHRFTTITVNEIVGRGLAGTPEAIQSGFLGRDITRRADGGAIAGPGTGTSDSIPALLSNGEHVLTASDVQKAGGHGAIYRMREAIQSGVARFATGGAVGEAVAAARSVNGNPYGWGDTGPTTFDCSGFVGWLQSILMGKRSTSRLYTTYSLIGGATAGLEPGLDPSSPFNVGVSDEHMAATLDGYNVEAGGSHGTSSIGGPAVGAQDGQFPYKFHLPVELIAGYTTGDAALGGAKGGSGRVSTWTEKDDLDLQSARVAIEQAKEARDKIRADGKKSDADKQQADLKVAKAEQKVIDLEKKRDSEGAVSALSTEPAPELTGAMSDDQLELRTAEIAVTDAQLQRDQTYADPESTSIDKEKADMAVYQANNRLAETQKKLATANDELSAGKESGAFSLKDRLQQFGSDVVGIAYDSFWQILGVDEPRWFGLKIPEVPQQSGKSGKAAGGDPISDALAGVPSSFPAADLANQNPVAVGSPNWIDNWVKALPMKLYDSGGVIPHGGMGLNLSGAPEAVLTNDQMATLTRIADLDIADRNSPGGQSGRSGMQITNQITVSDERSQIRKLQESNKRMLMQYGGAMP